MSGSSVINVGTRVTAAPDLGDERWSQLLTYSIGGQRSVVKQTAIRTGDVLITSPARRGSWTPTWRRRSPRPRQPSEACLSGALCYDRELLTVAAIADSLSSTAPVPRGVMPESARDRLLHAPAR
ncbi:hypothetical protein [Streptomyces sp. B21-097]|uniref:hypothetical protein n=1 Tax=Streptomyces sp. B21-097 TaxID=3039414 RepID=UPI002FF30B6D